MTDGAYLNRNRQDSAPPDASSFSRDNQIDILLFLPEVPLVEVFHVSSTPWKHSSRLSLRDRESTAPSPIAKQT